MAETKQDASGNNGRPSAAALTTLFTSAAMDSHHRSRSATNGKGIERVAEIFGAKVADSKLPAEKKKKVKRRPLAFYVIPAGEIVSVIAEVDYGTEQFLEEVARELRKQLGALEIVTDDQLVIVTFIKHHIGSVKYFLFHSGKRAEKYADVIVDPIATGRVLFEILRTTEKSARTRVVLFGRDKERKPAIIDSSTEKSPWTLAKYFTPFFT